MRRLLFATAALAVMAAGALAPSRASALTLAPSALATAIPETRLAENVAWRCSNFWNGRFHRFSRCFWMPRQLYGYGGHLGPRFRYGHRHFRHH